MLKIKFSHHYYKLQYQGNKAILISATPYKIDDNTPESFIAYDTYYYPDGHYELKPGEYVLLLFLGENGVFTTIRSREGSHGNNLEYYSKLVGKEFEIVVEEQITGK